MLFAFIILIPVGLFFSYAFQLYSSVWFGMLECHLLSSHSLGVFIAENDTFLAPEHYSPVWLNSEPLAFVWSLEWLRIELLVMKEQAQREKGDKIQH